MPSQSKGLRHRWKDSEYQQVLRRALELRSAESYVSIKQASWDAQSVLPEDRRKTAYYSNLQVALKRDIIRAEEQRRRTAEPDLVVRNADDSVTVVELKTPDDAPDPTPAEAVLAPPTLMQMCAHIGSALGVALAEELGPTLMDAMRETIAAQVNKAIEMAQQGMVMPESLIDFGDRKSKPRVAIAGLLEEQRRTVEEAFPNVDFRWVSHFAGKGTMKKVAGTCTEVYLMTKFISHATQNATPREKRVMVNGGVRELTRLLGARYANGNGTQHH